MLHTKTLIYSFVISDFTLNYNNNNTYIIYTLWCNYGDVRLNCSGSEPIGQIELI